MQNMLGGGGGARMKLGGGGGGVRAPHPPPPPPPRKSASAIFAPRPHMGNVVPMDSKLLSNYWYMSWPSWPTHISKLCSHKDDNFVMRFIRHCTESDSHKSRCGWTLKKNYRSPSGFETIRITNVQTDAITNFFRQQQRNLSSFRGRFCGFTTIR